MVAWWKEHGGLFGDLAEERALQWGGGWERQLDIVTSWGLLAVLKQGADFLVDMDEM